MLRRLCINSPAPHSRISDSAICRITSVGRNHSRRGPATRPPVNVSGEGVRIAGASPNNIDAAIVVSNENPAIRQSTVASSNRAIPAGANCRNRRSKTDANSNPLTPPRTPNDKLSVNACRASRVLPAPIAARTASSRLRVAVRASNRFATLATAISKTSDTAPNSTSAARPLSRTCRSRRGLITNRTSFANPHGTDFKAS